MQPPDPPLHPTGLSIPMTQTLTQSIPPLTLPKVIQPPPDSTADPDLDNTEPCEAFTFDDSTLEHIMDTYSSSYSINKTTSIMCLNPLLPIMGLLLIGSQWWPCWLRCKNSGKDW